MNKKLLPEFLIDADNVYRTKYFIVKQKIGIQKDCEQNNVVFSHDTYYRRTLLRDLEYEIAFKHKKQMNGKRLPTTMYARVYVE